MLTHKWLFFLGAVLLSLTPLFSFTAVSAQANPSPWKTVPPQAGHFRPPIQYGQVAKPVRPDKPGHGPSQTTSVVYTPANIQGAYDFGSFAGGSGEAIAIVDAYGDPKLASDLAAFDSKFGISAPPALNISYPAGTPRGSNSGWAVETALDVEWAHANAPDATVDVVVSPDSGFADLLTCINYAATLPNVAAISMSWGAPENGSGMASVISAYDSAFQNITASGIALLAASGDNGADDGTSSLTVDYPASSLYTIAVGGTSLTLGGSGGYGSETAWSGSGGGYSVFEPEQSWQSDASITDPSHMRGVPDVAFDADPNTGVYVYQNGWYAVGGTSVGAPNWAAIVADNAAVSGTPLDNTCLYANAADMHDVVSGNNGYYPAVVGWDPVTGLGSPDVASLISPSDPSPDFTLSVSPSSQSVVQGDNATYLVTITPVNGFTGIVDLSVDTSGLAASLSPTSVSLTSGSSATSTLTVATTSTTITGSYPLTVTGAGTSGSPSHSVSAGLTLTSSSAATLVSVLSIGYSPFGGKNGNNNLSITVSLVDNLGNPVPNASVTITVDLNGSPYASGTGTTGSSGSVSFTISHALSGTYTTTVYSVSASGLTWDGVTPSNSYTK